MKIAIFTGGDSSEAVVSVKSAAQVRIWLEAKGHSCHMVTVTGPEWKVSTNSGEADLDRNTFGFSGPDGPVRFDFAWNMIHGTPGEDGKLQGYFDMMRIPHSSSGHASAALTFDKHVCKTYLRQHQVLTPESCLVTMEQDPDLEHIAEKVGFPCFVKPNSGGSSFGIAKVLRHEDLEPAIRGAWKEDRSVIIERYIKGTEVTCGLLRKKGEFVIFPVTEIVPKNEFFDYEAKYTRGMADEITPARIDDALARKCQELAGEIYNLTFCSGLIRVDFIIKGNQLYFLELNSIPGLTRESILPQQVESAGYLMEDVIQWVIDDALARNGQG